MQVINDFDTFVAARAAFKQELTLDEINNSIMGKILDGRITPPHAPKKLGKYTILGNKLDNDISWKVGGPTASMSWFHKFIVPTVTTDWKYFNPISFPANPDTLTMLDEMETLAKSEASSFGVTNPILLFHCYPNNSIPYLHLHILDGDYLGPSYVAQVGKNLHLDTVRKVIEHEMLYNL